MPNRSSILWRLTVALVAVFAGPHISAQQKPAAPSRFVQPEPIDFNDHDGWTQIFDGKTLNAWDGPPDVWRVEDGAIVGESSPEHPSGITNIIWRGGEPGNFSPQRVAEEAALRKEDHGFARRIPLT